MTINIAIIGCGKRFREFYLDPLLQLKKDKRINFVSLYSRNIQNHSDLESIFQCKLSNKLSDVISRKDIDLIILTLPIDLRKKIFSNINFRPRFLLTESPFTNNLSEFYKYKNILEKKLINFEVFEDKFFYNYSEYQNLNLTKVIIFNKLWAHHALGFLFKITNIKSEELNNITYKIYGKLEIFKISFNNFSFYYVFSKNKNDAERKNGRIKVYGRNNKIIKLKQMKLSTNDTKKAIFDSITNLINLDKKKMYSKNYLESENTIITLMKFMRKFNLKKINSIQIYFLKIFFKFHSFF